MTQPQKYILHHIILSLIFLGFIGFVFYFLITLPKEWSFERQEVSDIVLIGNNSLVGQVEPVVAINLGEQTISAYSPKEGCTNPQCLMANGEVAHLGAVVNNQYPLGTKVLINGKNYTIKEWKELYNKRPDSQKIFRSLGYLCR